MFEKVDSNLGDVGRLTLPLHSQAAAPKGKDAGNQGEQEPLGDTPCEESEISESFERIKQSLPSQQVADDYHNLILPLVSRDGVTAVGINLHLDDDEPDHNPASYRKSNTVVEAENQRTDNTGQNQLKNRTSNAGQLFPKRLSNFAKTAEPYSEVVHSQNLLRIEKENQPSDIKLKSTDRQGKDKVDSVFQLNNTDSDVFCSIDYENVKKLRDKYMKENPDCMLPSIHSCAALSRNNLQNVSKEKLGSSGSQYALLDPHNFRHSIENMNDHPAARQQQSLSAQPPEQPRKAADAKRESLVSQQESLMAKEDFNGFQTNMRSVLKNIKLKELDSFDVIQTEQKLREKAPAQTAPSHYQASTYVQSDRHETLQQEFYQSQHSESGKPNPQSENDKRQLTFTKHNNVELRFGGLLHSDFNNFASSEFQAHQQAALVLPPPSHEPARKALPSFKELNANAPFINNILLSDQQTNKETPFDQFELSANACLKLPILSHETIPFLQSRPEADSSRKSQNHLSQQLHLIFHQKSQKHSCDEGSNQKSVDHGNPFADARDSLLERSRALPNQTPEWKTLDAPSNANFAKKHATNEPKFEPPKDNYHSSKLGSQSIVNPLVAPYKPNIARKLFPTRNLTIRTKSFESSQDRTPPRADSDAAPAHATNTKHHKSFTKSPSASNVTDRRLVESRSGLLSHRLVSNLKKPGGDTGASTNRPVSRAKSDV